MIILWWITSVLLILLLMVVALGIKDKWIFDIFKRKKAIKRIDDDEKKSL